MSVLRDLVERRRSFRRFDEAQALGDDVLRGLVDLACKCSSGLNRQPLRYVFSNTPESNAVFFRHLKWAGDLADWSGPKPGERPAAYILMLADIEVGGVPEFDAGIAAQTMLLGAAEQGLGGCMLGGYDRDGLRKDLNVPARYDMSLVLALGKPAERVVLEDARLGDDLRYWRDAADVHHVPKLALDDVILTMEEEGADQS